MTTWSDLLPEILNRIAGKLEFYEDYINFLCVCTSWKSSATSTTKNLIQHLPSRLPMLMLAESDKDEDNNNEQHEQHRRFFLLSNGGTMRKLPLPEVHWQRCISTHGWLITTGEQEFYAKLANPVSRTQLKLLELYMFDELYTDQDEWMYYGSCMRKAVFTSPNPLSSDPSFRVIIIWGETIGFCRSGDVSWTRTAGKDACLILRIIECENDSM
ncbi:putative F-box domain-containing protein [Helianthus annuus]|nr:putative F-box domain-containing protein [Helianthus annuus]